MNDPFARLDARAQAALVQRGEVSPLELTEAAIGRIEALDPILNAVPIRDFERARTAARSVDRSLPFAGVPFLVKDLVASMAGVRQTEGSRFLRDHIAKEDSYLVRRFRNAGLILLGRANSPEFGNMATTEGTLHGTCVNPWEPTLTTGGSSGGSAAAVAAGLVPMAHANDGGGSIRIPASCTGTFGLKPSRGRVSLGPAFGTLYGGLIAEHAITRTVRDSAALLDITSGAEPGDPYTSPPSDRTYLAACDEPRARLRIGIWPFVPDGVSGDPACMEAVSAAGRLCLALGHQVETDRPDFAPDYLVSFYEVWSDCNAWMLERYERALGRKANDDELEPLTRSLIAAGAKRTSAQHMDSIERMESVGRRFAEWFVAHDVWMAPTLSWPPVPLGSFSGVPAPDGSGFGAFAGGDFSPYTALANISGLPAMSVPLATTASGLPIGVQFVAGSGREDRLFGLAAELEEALPWRDRWPPISAAAGDARLVS